MGGDKLEVRQAVGAARHALAVISHGQIVCAVLAAAHDGNGCGLRIHAVLDELGDRLEWVGLRERDNSNGIPIIADPQFAAL